MRREKGLNAILAGAVLLSSAAAIPQSTPEGRIRSLTVVDVPLTATSACAAAPLCRAVPDNPGVSCTCARHASTKSA